MRIIITLTGIMCCLTGSAQWSTLGKGFDYPGRILYYDTVNSTLIAGGNFIYADSILVNGIAAWNGSTWQNYDTGAPFGASVYSLTKYQSTLYASSIFSSPSPNSNWFYKWNGTNWVNLVPNLNGPISTFKEHNNELYFGGAFTFLDSISYPLFGKYDGMLFTNLNLQSKSYGVLAIEFYKNNFYIGGNFYDSINLINDIELWDGSQFNSFGGGGTTSGLDYISSMAIYNNELYIGGSFSSVGNCNANNIIKWDGSQFFPLAGGVSGPVNRIKSYSDGIYICGTFNTVDTISVTGIARWDGQTWFNVCPSFSNNGISDILKYNNDLYITGGFNIISGVNYNYIAKYSLNNSITENNISRHINIFPNPTTGKFNVSYQLNNHHKVSLIISDLLGRHLKEFDLYNSDGSYKVDLTEFEDGIYLVSLVKDGIFGTAKIIKY